MRTLASLLAAAAIAAFGLGFPGTAHAADFVVDLTADNGDGVTGINVGTVTVSDNGGSFDVTYATTSPWVIVEIHTHADADDDCTNVPQTKKGSPKIGKFDFATEYTLATAVTSATHTIADIADVFCVAAHAVVFDPTADADLQAAFDLTEETAWGDGDGGTEFQDDRGWATYFTVDANTL